MLFSSTVFLYLFLPCVLIFYYVFFKKSRKLQNVFLLLSSLFFYAWGEPKFVFIMILSIVINWIGGLLIDKKRENKIVSVMVLVLCLIIDLGILFVFKYLGFACNIVNTIFKSSFDLVSIALPIGISFYTFQAISYVLDVYKGKVCSQKNPISLGLYISFFPQLIAGPIVRYETIEKEIENRKENIEDFFEGIRRFIVGLSKKVLLANSFAIVADCAFGMNDTSVLFAWLGAVFYSFQILYDFSGYSDMAIGLGRMFGFHFLENFNYPYISKSISEFWRRWHISLGTWFRDYLYFPLGGSRKGLKRTIFNLFVVWLLTGIWHGANYTFVIWGLMFFVLISIEKILKTKINIKETKAIAIAKWIYTYFFVVIGWVLFRSDSIRSAIQYLKCMFGLNHNKIIDGNFVGHLSQNIIILLIGIIMSMPILKSLKEKISGSVIVLFALFVLCVSSIVSSSYNPFIYFNF